MAQFVGIRSLISLIPFLKVAECFRYLSPGKDRLRREWSTLLHQPVPNSRKVAARQAMSSAVSTADTRDRNEGFVSVKVTKSDRMRSASLAFAESRDVSFFPMGLGCGDAY